MKLLVTAADAPEDQTVSYSFRLGFKCRHRPGNSIPAAFAITSLPKIRQRIRLGCGVDCEGGGINVAISKDDKSAHPAGADPDLEAQ